MGWDKLLFILKSFLWARKNLWTLFTGKIIFVRKTKKIIHIFLEHYVFFLYWWCELIIFGINDNMIYIQQNITKLYVFSEKPTHKINNIFKYGDNCAKHSIIQNLTKIFEALVIFVDQVLWRSGQLYPSCIRPARESLSSKCITCFCFHFTYCTCSFSWFFDYSALRIYWLWNYWPTVFFLFWILFTRLILLVISLRSWFLHTQLALHKWMH